MLFLRNVFLIVTLLSSHSIFSQEDSNPYIVVLGIAQDAGYPQAGCTKSCCEMAWKNDSLKKSPVSLALVDPKQKKWWLFEATPDISKQIHLFGELTNNKFPVLPEGIFLTHAHIGHYAGLMQFGKEAMNTKELSVFVLPRMKNFLEGNGPWNQLVKTQNIVLREMYFGNELSFGDISVSPFQVVHRDEYSETAGFRIKAGNRKYLFIPDINSWENFDLNAELKNCDIAFLDATFYSGDELPNRNLKEIPHPLVVQTMKMLENQTKETKSKVHFIHFNHSNPLLYNKQIRDSVEKAGFKIASEGKRY